MNQVAANTDASTTQSVNNSVKPRFTTMSTAVTASVARPIAKARRVGKIMAVSDKPYTNTQVDFRPSSHTNAVGNASSTAVSASFGHRLRPHIFMDASTYRAA